MPFQHVFVYYQPSVYKTDQNFPISKDSGILFKIHWTNEQTICLVIKQNGTLVIKFSLVFYKSVSNEPKF